LLEHLVRLVFAGESPKRRFARGAAVVDKTKCSANPKLKPLDADVLTDL
jgi:hypothetical protein